MDYETFKQEMKEDLKQRLYERGIEDVEMSFHNVEKANQHYESLTVRQEGSNVGVNFNIENAFAEYEHTGDYAGVLAESTHAIMQGLENVPSVDASELINYEVMKEKLSIEVISAETNAELLTKVPHESMEDMAVVYRFVLESNDTGRASILVTNDMIDHMGVTHEQLKADALENAPEIRPAVIQGMSEVMREMMGPEAFEMFGLPEEQEEMMYVATVPDKNSGAGFLELDPNLEKLRDLKEDYIEFNNQEYESEFDVLTNLNVLINKYKHSDQSIFSDFALFLIKNKEPIVNSFIKVKVYRKSARNEQEYYARLSNGPMESINRKPKDFKRESRGFSDFNYTRNRILWATRDNPSVRGIPKSKDEIKKNKGKKTRII